MRAVISNDIPKTAGTLRVSAWRSAEPAQVDFHTRLKNGVHVRPSSNARNNDRNLNLATRNSEFEGARA
jgi:hypothetical protein